QTLNLTEEGVLVSENSEEDSKITAPAPATLISEATWRFDKEKLGGKFVAAYANVVSESKAIFKTAFQYFEFKFDGKSSNNTLSFKNGKYNGMIYITIKDAGNNGSKISFSSTGDGDNNGKVHLEKIPAYKAFLDLLTSTEYVATSKSAIMPSTIILTSVTDANDYVTIDIK
ncbi:MAG: hypothetical protein RSA66_11390, partial [Muribaculaceae bacterium]